MNEDDAPATGGDALARTYDYFKHVTALSLVSLGGVLGLPQLQNAPLPRVAMLAVLALIANAGAIGLMGSSMMAGAELAGGDMQKLKRSLRLLQMFATSTLFFGLGIFLGLFTRVI